MYEVNILPMCVVDDLTDPEVMPSVFMGFVLGETELSWLLVEGLMVAPLGNTELSWLLGECMEVPLCDKLLLDGFNESLLLDGFIREILSDA